MLQGVVNFTRAVGAYALAVYEASNARRLEIALVCLVATASLRCNFKKTFVVICFNSLCRCLIHNVYISLECVMYSWHCVSGSCWRQCGGGSHVATNLSECYCIRALLVDYERLWVCMAVYH